MWLERWTGGLYPSRLGESAIEDDFANAEQSRRYPVTHAVRAGDR
jgi:hypothetical protein